MKSQLIFCLLLMAQTLNAKTLETIFLTMELPSQWSCELQQGVFECKNPFIADSAKMFVAADLPNKIKPWSIEESHRQAVLFLSQRLKLLGFTMLPYRTINTEVIGQPWLETELRSKNGIKYFGSIFTKRIEGTGTTPILDVSLGYSMGQDFPKNPFEESISTIRFKAEDFLRPFPNPVIESILEQ